MIAALALCPGAGAKAKGFTYGVAAGDVTSSSAILWAKADEGGTAYLQLRDNGGFGDCGTDGVEAEVKAKKKNDYTVQAKVKKLEPDTAYKYRWCMPGGGARSDTGKFTTAPDARPTRRSASGSPATRTLGPLPGGTTPYWNNFEIWTAIRQQNNDFNVLDGRHDVLGHRGPGLHARRRRPHRAAEAGGLQDQPRR